MTKIKNLPDKERKLMRIVIRDYCISRGVFKRAHIRGIGIEATEEYIEQLIDDKKLMIVFNSETNTLSIEIKRNNNENKL